MKYKAKKYKLHDHFLTKEGFHQMMTNLPEFVSEEEVSVRMMMMMMMMIMMMKMMMMMLMMMPR